MAGSFDAIVIGGGANGLVAAVALGRAGLRVLLLEENDALGGQGRVHEFAPGFRAAPLTMNAGWAPPMVLRGLGLELERAVPDASVTVLAGPREFLTLWNDPARAADALRRFSPRDAEQWPAFTTRLHKLAGVLAELYKIPAPDIDTTAPPEMLALLGVARTLRRLGRAEMIEFLRIMPMSVQELVNDWFESEPLKAAIAAGGVQSLQQGPRSGGTSFVLLHYLIGAESGMVRPAGWWRGRPDAFVLAAADAARRHGVQLRSNAPVQRIQVRDDAVAGVVLATGEEIAATRVLSTADPARTLLGLVDPVWLDPEFLDAVRNIKFRGCTAFVLYALDALPDCPGLATELLNGTVSLTPSTVALERAADAAKYHMVSDPPHVELSVPTLRWPNSPLAPAGKHVLIATAQYAPYNLRDGAQWNAARREAFADRITATIEAVVPCFTSRVLHRAALTPFNLEQQYSLTEGALTHGELMLDQILFMRPVPGWGRYAMPIRGLYLGGAGTHPGPGVLGGPGWLAAQALRKDAKQKK